MCKATLMVHVNPGSSRDQAVGWNGDVLSIKVSARPVDGAANRACIKLLSDILGVRKSQIMISSGITGRNKVFEINGMSDSELRQIITHILR